MLRLATPSDFEIFKSLYDNYDCDILYEYSKEDFKYETVEIDKETEKQLDEELQISKEKFEHILSDKNQVIFMIENKDEIIGFIWMFLIKNERWKLVSFSLLPSHKKNNFLLEIIENLQYRKMVKEIDIYSTSPFLCNLFENLGACKISNFYYRIQ